MKLSGTRAILFECEGVHDVFQCLADSFRVWWLWVGWGATVGRMRIQTFLVPKLKYYFIVKTYLEWIFIYSSPCKLLRWFYIKHHYSVHSEMHERRTYLVPCELWRRSFSHSFQCPGNSSSEHEPQQLFGHRPGCVVFFRATKKSILFTPLHGQLSFHSTHPTRSNSDHRWRDGYVYWHPAIWCRFSTYLLDGIIDSVHTDRLLHLGAAEILSS